MKLIKAQCDKTFAAESSINFVQFAELVDQSQDLKNQVGARVYINVHNRGVLVASQIRVRVLISTCIGSTAPVAPTANNKTPDPKPPRLPDNYWVNLANNQPIPRPSDNNPGWYDIGEIEINQLMAGLPKVVSLDVDPCKLPRVGQYVVLALVSHFRDPYDSQERDVDQLILTYRKAAMTYVTVKPKPQSVVINPFPG